MAPARPQRGESPSGATRSVSRRCASAGLQRRRGRNTEAVAARGSGCCAMAPARPRRREGPSRAMRSVSRRCAAEGLQGRRGQSTEAVAARDSGCCTVILRHGNGGSAPAGPRRRRSVPLHSICSGSQAAHPFGAAPAAPCRRRGRGARLQRPPDAHHGTKWRLQHFVRDTKTSSTHGCHSEANVKVWLKHRRQCEFNGMQRQRERRPCSAAVGSRATAISGAFQRSR